MMNLNKGAVREEAYGDGKRYIFPRSFLLIVEPFPGQADSLLLSIHCRNGISPDFIQQKPFSEFQKQGNQLIIKRDELPKIISEVKRIDLHWQERN